MKPRTLMCITAAVLFAALAIPVRITGQEQGQGHHHYKLVDLGTFGGPQSSVFLPDDSYAPVLNNQGTIVGSADTSAPDPFPAFCFGDCFVSHAFQRQDGVMSDLGVLPGGASSASDWISANGLIAGWSENGLIDPVFSGFPELHAVLWKDGEIVDLGTLPDGGFESVASAVNSRGQVVGAAANLIPDSSPMAASNFGWITETRAFLWQSGEMQDLGTLGGPDAVALLVNERGQIVGDSYTSSAPSAYCATATFGGFSLTTGAFLWEDGQMKNLGNFGGTCTFAFDLNNRGQVIGASTLAGDLAQHPFLWDQGVLTDLGTLGGSVGNAVAINDAGEITGFAREQGDQTVHAFLWKNGTMTDLGTVVGDTCSVGFSINARGQVVGQSVPGCNFENLSQIRAFLSEDGEPPVDLNTLISPSPLHLTTPATINDRGEITGLGLLPNGDQHAFLLIPCDENETHTEGCGDGNEIAAPVTASSTAAVAHAPTAASPATLASGELVARLRARLAPRYRSPAVAAPSAPYNLTATAQNTYQIGLNWQEASGQNQNGFNIYRCQGCSSPRTQGTKIASVGASVFTYTDGSASNPLVESTTYTYQVTAFNGGGESGPSNTASATTKTEPAPTNLKDFAFRRRFLDTVKLSWTNNSTDDDSYHIEQCAGATCTGFTEIAHTGANVTTYTLFFQFSQGLTFRWRVRAHSPGGYSSYSNIVTQTLP